MSEKFSVRDGVMAAVGLLMLVSLSVRFFGGVEPPNEQGNSVNNENSKYNSEDHDKLASSSSNQTESLQPKAQKAEGLLANITNQDRENTVKYGACAALSKAAIKLVKAQVNLDRSTSEVMLHSYASQAAVYTILIADIAKKYDDVRIKELAYVSNEFVRDDISKQTSITGDYIKSSMQAQCPDDFGNRAFDIMNKREDEFNYLKNQFINI